MKSKRVFAPVLTLALAGLLLANGCKKQNQQPNNTTATASQPAVPPPPPDQPGAAPAANAPPAGTASAPPSSESANASAASGALAPPPPLVIPAGTHIAVTIQQALGSRISQAGETFTATVAQPILIDGQTAIRSGASATGTVVDAKPLGRFKGKAYLALRLDTVRAMGATYQVASSTLERVEQGKGKRTAGMAGGGAGFGAIIGGLAGGGKGALIGGLVGGGAGAAGSGLTGKKDILIPAETTLTFRLRRSVHVSQ
jgi:hypothetical protein